MLNALVMAGQLRSRSRSVPWHPAAGTFDTCEIIEERWANWLRRDPVVAIETRAGNLGRLKALYIDCGKKDQFNLLYGARRFVRRLNELGIAHRYEAPTTTPVSITDGCELAFSRPGIVRLISYGRQRSQAGCK